MLLTEAVLVGLIVVGLVTLTLSVVFTVCEYAAARLDDMDEALARIGEQEVYGRIVRPTLLARLEAWAAPSGRAQARRLSCAVGNPDHEVAAAFVSLRKALLPDEDDRAVWEGSCLAALRAEFAWWPPGYLARRVAEAPGGWPPPDGWRDPILEDLLQHLEDGRVAVVAL